MSMLERIIGHRCLQIFVDVVQTHKQLANCKNGCVRKYDQIQSVFLLHIPKRHWWISDRLSNVHVVENNSTLMFTSTVLHIQLTNCKIRCLRTYHQCEIVLTPLCLQASCCSLHDSMWPLFIPKVLDSPSNCILLLLIICVWFFKYC